jgi:hypothetical protein
MSFGTGMVALFAMSWRAAMVEDSFFVVECEIVPPCDPWPRV